MQKSKLSTGVSSLQPVKSRGKYCSLGVLYTQHFDRPALSTAWFTAVAATISSLAFLAD